MKNGTKYLVPVAVLLFVAFILIMMKVMTDTPLLMFDRFLPGAGWVQISLLAAYGALLAVKMQDPRHSALWRKRSWLFFSIFFFSQFALGLVVDERFLMSGTLHLPAPFMIVAGPVYRGQMTIMPILLLSSIILSGPAWCSHYCYFGAWDGLAAGNSKKESGIRNNRNKKAISNKWAWKWSFLVLVMVFAIIFRLAGLEGWQTLGPALGLALLGVGIMIVISGKQEKMVHCTAFCPIGTIVSYARYISPFRMKIESSCTSCMRCVPYCPYDALNPEDIKSGKPGLTCTLCGDCITSCKFISIQYRFFNMKPEAARNLYLLITISLHVLCLGMARM